jgi:hypothetical protein
MKKSKFLVLGLIALMLAGGLVLASCGSKCTGDGNCVYKFPTEEQLNSGSVTEPTLKQCKDLCVGKQAVGITVDKLIGKTFKCDC